MAVLIFKLRGAPDDEADDIRQLLDDNHFDWYETTAGNWGISMPGIWLSDDSQKDHAEELIKDYQVDRYIRVRGEYEQLKREGKHRKLIDVIKEDPGKFALYVIGIAAILYFSVEPFVDMFLNPGY
ncbi:MAG: Unknown protein [uncultured Thiotrichaceae bacterium]|uniref:Uncharacterized protein n=1 Tax=uncultured Thiotrichaceae bacterium TaxID=298394 RepID=A0A6S6TWA1_9GAMM|nr:MAG: Unknown protein [uncultured Thiotrichaceae bacterium]